MCAIPNAAIHLHFKPTKPIILWSDTTGFAITSIPKQYDSFEILKPVNFYS